MENETATTEAIEATTTKQPLGPRQQKLVDALIGGWYQQGHNALKKDGKYCCLGVACDLLSDGWDKEGMHWVVSGTKESSYLTDKVAAFYKFRNATGIFTKRVEEADGFVGNISVKVSYEGREYTSLTQMNDGTQIGNKRVGRLTFKQIGKFIQEHPELIFDEPV